MYSTKRKGGIMDKTLAHELAEEFAGVENEDASVTRSEDGSFIVELTSDIRVYVSPDEVCEYI
jgi:hypothetical protein